MKKLRVLLNRGKVEKCTQTEVPKLGPRPSAKENKTCTQPRSAPKCQREQNLYSTEVPKEKRVDDKLRCLTLSLRTEKVRKGVRKELLESVKEKEKRKCTSVKEKKNRNCTCVKELS